ncbi:MAG TPA: diguanylate cyclase [Gaiellaceae bacterium]|nr:diguanylate cyclase [Gaiellaceae bacterium]
MGADTQTDPGRLEIDQVTGLADRKAMLADLTEAVVPDCPPALLMVFAFDGFNEYEELHGVLEGRKLLRRLADRLGAVLDGIGTGYRPRGDEFAALVPQPSNAGDVLRASIAALTERDRYYSVIAAGGYAVVPIEATDPIAALAIADRRLSANAPRRGPRVAASRR